MVCPSPLGQTALGRSEWEFWSEGPDAHADRLGAEESKRYLRLTCLFRPQASTYKLADLLHKVPLSTPADPSPESDQEESDYEPLILHEVAWREHTPDTNESPSELSSASTAEISDLPTAPEAAEVLVQDCDHSSQTTAVASDLTAVPVATEVLVEDCNHSPQATVEASDQTTAPEAAQVLVEDHDYSQKATAGASDQTTAPEAAQVLVEDHDYSQKATAGASDPPAAPEATEVLMEDPWQFSKGYRGGQWPARSARGHWSPRGGLWPFLTGYRGGQRPDRSPGVCWSSRGGLWPFLTGYRGDQWPDHSPGGCWSPHGRPWPFPTGYRGGRWPDPSSSWSPHGGLWPFLTGYRSGQWPDFSPQAAEVLVEDCDHSPQAIMEASDPTPVPEAAEVPVEDCDHSPQATVEGNNQTAAPEAAEVLLEDSDHSPQATAKASDQAAAPEDAEVLGENVRRHCPLRPSGTGVPRPLLSRRGAELDTRGLCALLPLGTRRSLTWSRNLTLCHPKITRLQRSTRWESPFWTCSERCGPPLPQPRWYRSPVSPSAWWWYRSCPCGRQPFTKWRKMAPSPLRGRQVTGQYRWPTCNGAARLSPLPWTRPWSWSSKKRRRRIWSFRCSKTWRNPMTNCSPTSRRGTKNATTPPTTNPGGKKHKAEQ